MERWVPASFPGPDCWLAKEMMPCSLQFALSMQKFAHFILLSLALSAGFIANRTQAATAGSVVAWGYDYDGQVTVPIAAQSGVSAVAAGWIHTVALRTNGSVVAWGWNAYGQTTVPVNAQNGVSAIAAGLYHTAALKNDGSVIAWGGNDYGLTNVPIGGQSGVTAIDLRYEHIVALKTNGTVVAWGWNPGGAATAPAGPDGHLAGTSPPSSTVTAANADHNTRARNRRHHPRTVTGCDRTSVLRAVDQAHPPPASPA